MPTRVETTAATRRALLRAASELLDGGGPAAVTLRSVGALAGVSYQAPYRHFVDKDHLLAAVAEQAWDELAAELRCLVQDLPRRGAPPGGPGAHDTLRSALQVIIETGRRRPHLYRLMFTPASPTSPVAQAAGRAQQVYLDLVTSVVGEQAAWQYGGMLLISVHGLIGFEMSAFLTGDKWPKAEELLDLLIARLPHADDRRPNP